MNKLTKTAIALGSLASLAPIAAMAQDYDYSYSTTADSAAAGGILAGLAVFWIIFLIIGLVLFVFWIIMLIDAFKRTNWKQESDKNTWLIVLIVGFVLGLGGLAAIIYYFAVKRTLDKGGKTPPAQPQTPSQPTQS